MTLSTQSTYASLTTTVSRLLNIKQQDRESLIEYTRRFKQARDVTLSHVGGEVLDTFVEHTEEYQQLTQEDEKLKMKAQAFNKWMAFLYLKNSDQNRYGSLLTGLASQYSLKKDQYPTNLADATDVLNNHKHDNWKK